MIDAQPYPYSDVVETRTQTPTKTKAINVQIGAGDVISNLPVVVDFPHHQIHEGETHQYTYPPTAIANGATLDHRIVVASVPALMETRATPHMTIEVDSNTGIFLYLYETPTTTGNGTQQSVYNKNRNKSAVAPTTTVWLAPTVTGAGTLLSAWMVGSGEKAGGSTRESLEWDLKSNTVYLIRMVAQSAGSVCMRAIWYEDLGV